MLNASRRTSCWLGLVLMVALLVRIAVAFLLLGDMPPVSDAAEYSSTALMMLNGSMAGRAYYWPPANCYVLLGSYYAFGNSLFITRIVTVAVSMLSVVLTAVLCRQVLPEGRGRIVGPCFAALYGPALLLSGQPYSQHLASACMLTIAIAIVGMLTQYRLFWNLILGVSLGLGILTRPSMYSLVPVVLAAVFVAATRTGEENVKRRVARRLGRAFTVLLMAAGIIVPVQARNAACGAGWTVSTNNERNLFLGNNPFTPDYKTSHFAQRSLDEVSPAARDYLRAFYQHPNSRVAMRAEALRYIKEHPWRTTFRSANRTLGFWGFDYMGSRIIQDHYALSRAKTTLLLTVESGSYLVVMGLAIFGLLMPARRDISSWRWLLALVAFYQLPYCLAFSGGTYHFPVLWLLLPFASIACVGLKFGSLWIFWRTPKLLCIVTAFAAIQLQYAYYAFLMAR